MSDLAGRTALITGGATGIGAATCRAFVDHGAAVVLADLDEEGAEEVAAAGRTRREGASVDVVATDTADEASVARAVRRTVEQHGRIDVLVNCAAASIMEGIDASVEAWDRVLAVNVVGYALLAKHVVPEMRRRGSGAIVNVASISGVVAQPEHLTYSTTKGAVLAMTRGLALDLAPHGIRVNAVSPGTIWTESSERHYGSLGLDRRAADAHPEVGALHMLGRCGDPHEVAEAIVFLASDRASFITAENLMVDGGYVGT